MDEVFQLDLGEKVMDQITGFVGIVTARVQYIDKRIEYCLEAECKENEFKNGVWFPRYRLTAAPKQ